MLQLVLAYLLGAGGSAVVALLQHLRGLGLLDDHDAQAVPDQALHAVQVLCLWEAAVRLVTLRGTVLVHWHVSWEWYPCIGTRAENCTNASAGERGPAVMDRHVSRRSSSCSGM